MNAARPLAPPDRFPGSFSVAEPKQPKILVIRGGAIGDFILTLPSIRLVRAGFPTAHLEILGYPHIACLAARAGYADAVRPIEYAPLAAFFARNADLPEDLARYFAGFGQVISYLYDPDSIFADNLGRAGVRNFLAADPRVDGSAHAAVHLAKPLARLALFLDDPAPSIRPTAEEEREASGRVGPLSSPVIAIHPGSGSERKNWPVERWRQLVARLLAHGSHPTLLIVGGEADSDRIRALGLPRGEPRVQLVTGLPLPLLAALLARSSWFVGHDSGISHLAAAAGIPCTLLFGPTDPEIWAPRNPGVRVLRHPTGSLAAIGIEELLATFPEASGGSPDPDLPSARIAT